MNLFVDVETVRQYKEYADAPERVQKLFAKRYFTDYFQKEYPDYPVHELYCEKAGLYPEFGKIVCLSVGWVDSNGADQIRNYTGEEKYILTTFNDIIARRTDFKLIAHNGKNFDYPYITRRDMINGLPVLKPLNVFGLKPWEVKLIDTVDMWASTEWKPYISLDLMCECLGVESPKEGPVTGETLGDYYWNDPENSAKEIANYCGRDIKSLMKCYAILEELLAKKE